MEHPESRSHETLDPEDWGAVRILGHRMMDDMLDFLETIEEKPVWQPAPGRVKAHFNSPVPLEAQDIDEIYQEYLEYVHPYPIGNSHPRFWGWVFGTGTVMGALAEFLAGAMNTNAGDIDHHSANHVEKQVLHWIKEMIAYPADASGLLTSGCSAANLLGLTVARNAMAGFDLRKEGVNAAGKRLVLYASQEIHSSIQKAIEILGLGTDALRRVAVNENFGPAAGFAAFLRGGGGGNHQYRGSRRSAGIGRFMRTRTAVAAHRWRFWGLGRAGTRCKGYAARHGKGGFIGVGPAQMDVHAVRDRLCIRAPS